MPVMGVVYRAYDGKLERDLAIKVLAPGALDDEAARKRFRNEAACSAESSARGRAAPTASGHLQVTSSSFTFRPFRLDSARPGRAAFRRLSYTGGATWCAC